MFGGEAEIGEPMTMARAISALSRSSTSIEMWGCAARKAASVFGRYSESPDVLARKRTVALAPGQGAEIAAHRLDVMEYDLGVIEQAFAGRRQFDAAAAARQKRDAERCLQTLDLRSPRPAPDEPVARRW